MRTTTRIVILGASFGGLTVTHELRKMKSGSTWLP